MLRWLIVCALLAQTLALPRQSRHASWPKWMKMPQMEWPDWMPTQEDLPEVTIPEIQLPEMPKLPSVDIPDIQIPEINMQMPAAISDMFGRSRWNPSRQDGETTEQQRSQSSNDRREPKQRRGSYDVHIDQPSNVQQRPAYSYGQSRGQSNGRKGQSDRGAQQPSSNGQDRWSQPSRSDPEGRPNGQRWWEQTQERSNGQGRWPDWNNQDRASQTNTQGQWERSNGQGRWSDWNNQERGSQTNTRSQWEDRRHPDSNPAEQTRPGQTRPESQGRPSFGRGKQERPSRPNSRGQSQKDSERRPTIQRGGQTSSKLRKGSKETGEGPPQRDEPVRPFPGKPRRQFSVERISTRRRSEPSAKQQLEAFRTGMPRWLRDELNDTLSSMKEGIEEGRVRMDSWADDISEAAEGWWNRWTRRGSSRPQNNGRPGDRPGRHHSHGSGRHHGRGHGGSNGRGHTISNGRGYGGGRQWYNKWYEGWDQLENRTSCRRPFRPTPPRPRREEPQYTVLCGGNDYEARLYNSSVWVSVNVSAFTYDIAVHSAYIKLYKYMNGHNYQGTRISRTLPVQTKVKTISRDRRWFEKFVYTVSFYLPEDVQDDPPVPKDSNLIVHREEPIVYYAHSFRGYALEFNIWEYLNELTNTLDLSEEAYLNEDFIVNVYDAPWSFFNRRNDILIAMDTDVLYTPNCALPPTTELPTVVTTEIVTTIVEQTTATTTTAAAAATTDAATKRVTTAAPPDVQPTLGDVIPAAIIVLPDVKNPFENNNLEQEVVLDCEAGSECPRYDTAVTYDGFEQRQYAYSKWICMDQAACDFERAQYLTQGSLLEYFYPKGNREQIAMTITTPLVIGLDVSDLYRSDCGVVYTSCMFIPEEHQSAPLTPRDARLYIQDIPAMSRYVSTFGGYASSQNVPKLGANFLTKLEEARIPYDPSIVAVAQYTTSKFDKTRVNEIWVMDQSLLQVELGLE